MLIQQHNFTSLFSPPTMEYELVFIGLKGIVMVQKLVGEVAMRSSKEGFRAQLTQVSMDKVIHEALVQETSFFSLFTKGTAYTLL